MRAPCRGGAVPTGARQRRGFTLIEVVMALLVLEVAVLGVLGTLILADRTARRAERLARATGRVEAVLDSLRLGAVPGTWTESFDDVRLRGSVDSIGRAVLEARDEGGGLLLRAHSRVPPR